MRPCVGVARAAVTLSLTGRIRPARADAAYADNINVMAPGTVCLLPTEALRPATGIADAAAYQCARLANFFLDVSLRSAVRQMLAL
jgi:hypothetical protein